MNRREKTARRGIWKKLPNKRKILIIGGIVLIICIAGGLILINGRSKNAVAAASAVQETTVRTGDISNTIVGTGNLENEETSSVTIPSGVTIDEVLVESGDTVSAGDVLATVDESSVLGAMANVQDQIDELDGELSECADEDEQELTAGISGRIKRIYVQEGEDAAACIADNGALILISADGLMAVDLSGISKVEEEDEVTVTLSNGTVKEGEVETVSGENCTVTLSDSGTGMDDEVTVAAKDGTTLGTGTTYIHDSRAITAAGGTIADIQVSEDEAVSEDSVLLIMEGGEESSEYQKLKAQRDSLTESLQKLAVLAKDQAITAKEDGIISQVNVSDTSQSSTSTSDSADSADTAAVSGISQTSVQKASQRVIRLSSETGSEIDDTTEEDSADEPEEESGEESVGEVIQLQVVSSGNSTKSMLVIASPKTGQTPQSSIQALDGSYSGSICWSPADASFQAETVYQANIVLQADDNYVFSGDSITGTAVGVLSGISVSDDGKTMELQITFPATEADESDDAGIGEDQTSSSADDQTASGGGQVDEMPQQSTSDSSTGGSALSEIPGGSYSGSGVSSGNSSTADTTAGLTEETSDSSSLSSEYSSDVTAFTVASGDRMAISISVDELDINSVSEEQTAEVTLDAIEGETFSGTVTKVNQTSSSASGGVAKYTVIVSVSKTDEMKEGMNASAVIVVEQKEDVLTLPVEALQESGDEVFVYTRREDDGTLSGERQVTTGISDGSTVEITEGLSEGDTVYYERIGSDSTLEDSGGFGEISGGDMPNMENMPDMSEMPPEGEMPNAGDMPSSGQG
ncbi:MAG: biotin/lipoyl-binding protein [Ruminococcus sp.]|jgi:multidrug efflux pump subunit AcrA (membrane-fusion protein)